MKLAKSEVAHCMYCRRARKKLEQQVMAAIPPGRVGSSPPFTGVSLDLFGPIKCRGLGGGIRKTMKAWGVVFCCLTTKAVALLATTGYSTEAFLVVWRKFSAIYGSPSLVVSDPGSQLTSAAKTVDTSAGDISWDSVSDRAAKSGTRWLFTEPGCAWRNGQSKRMVGLAKSTLAHQLQGDLSLDWSELDSLLCEAAHIINNRPLAVRTLTADEHHAVTPNDILFGPESRDPT